MSDLPPALQDLVEKNLTKTASYQAAVGGSANPDQLAMAGVAAEREMKAARAAVEAVERFATIAMSTSGREYLVMALAIQHRTILAQTARAAAQAVMATTTTPSCLSTASQAHPTHDGRFTCSTVIGAQLMATQPLI